MQTLVGLVLPAPASVSFAHANLKGLLLLVSSNPSGSYRLSDFSSVGFPELWARRDL